MKYRKKIFYKLGLTTLIGLPLLFTACKEKQEPLHDTTYVWGLNNWASIQPLDQKVPSSADSASVRYVYLLNDGNSFHGAATTLVLKNMNMIIECVAPQNRHKIRGAGTLNDLAIGKQEHVQDSIKLANMGFKFGKVHYSGNFR